MAKEIFRVNNIFKINFYIFLTLFFTLNNSNAQTYLCVSDKTTGFKNSGGTWIETNFISDGKYILKWQNSYWDWKEVGKSTGNMCRAKNEDVFSCDITFSHLIFNKRLMRFAYSSPGGYALEALQGDTPFMTIGKCSAL